MRLDFHENPRRYDHPEPSIDAVPRVGYYKGDRLA